MQFRLAPYILICAILAGCATSDMERRAKTAEEVYAEAMEAFKDENWVDAQGLFDIIKLQFPASQFADDAQFYLAEINFKRGEYILGAYNYAMVRRMYPSSEHAKDALYKSALCYVEMSPPSDRDQEYTKKAIAAFNEFESAFPRDSLTFEAAKQIRTLRDKLAERYLESARHYVRARSNRAAVIYYDAVIDEYPDSQFFETALVEKASTLIDMKKYDDARVAIDMYKRTVRSGQMRSDIDRLEERLK